MLPIRPRRWGGFGGGGHVFFRESHRHTEPMLRAALLLLLLLLLLGNNLNITAAELQLIPDTWQREPFPWYISLVPLAAAAAAGKWCCKYRESSVDEARRKPGTVASDAREQREKTLTLSVAKVRSGSGGLKGRGGASRLALTARHL